MKITLLYGVFLRGECFEPAVVEGRDVDAGETVSVTPFWGVQLVGSGRARRADADAVPAASPLATGTATGAISTADPVVTHRDPRGKRK